jgi:hypothetical protein
MAFFPKIQSLFAVVGGFAAASALAGPADYLGMLKPPRTSLQVPTGLYSFTSSTPAALSTSLAGDAGYRLKLGYKYSRYFSVEGEYVDFGSAAGTIFGSQAPTLGSGFRSTGFGLDTVATVPFWSRFSFYGRLGAYRGDVRNAFSSHSFSLLGDHAQRATRLRVGLGLRYDFNPALGIHAGMQRYTPLASPFSSTETETDQFSVGVKWRF